MVNTRNHDRERKLKKERKNIEPKHHIPFLADGLNLTLIEFHGKPVSMKWMNVLWKPARIRNSEMEKCWMINKLIWNWTCNVLHVSIFFFYFFFLFSLFCPRMVANTEREHAHSVSLLSGWIKFAISSFYRSPAVRRHCLGMGWWFIW